MDIEKYKAELEEAIYEGSDGRFYIGGKVIEKVLKEHREVNNEAIEGMRCYGQFIKPLVWDDEAKEKHFYKCVSVAYVSLPTKGKWKGHIAICDEGDYGFKASVWLMNGGCGVGKYCRTIKETKVEAAKWWADFVGGFLNCP